MDKKIIFGSDHAGFDLKNVLIEYVKEMGFDVEDIGNFSHESCDYPVIAKDAAKKVLEQKCLGILVCGTGTGMAIAANRFKGIRAAVLSDTCSARMSRSHNDANVLCLGARIIGNELAKDIVKIWLSVDFLGGRHTKRVDMLDD